jgi:hypothetical protein
MDLFISLDPGHAQAIRQKLLEAFNNETDKNIRNKISDAVAEIARQYAENSAFPRECDNDINGCWQLTGV